MTTNLGRAEKYLTPVSLKKDRIARQIIEGAEAAGELQPGQIVVELTSGNTGTGLTFRCGVKGYPFVCCYVSGQLHGTGADDVGLG
jgi:cysteine synthase A